MPPMPPLRSPEEFFAAAPPIKVVTVTRTIRDDKSGCVKKNLRLIGHLPPGTYRDVGRNPFYIMGCRQDAALFHAPGYLRSKFLNETIRLEEPCFKRHNKPLCLTVEWRDRGKFLLLYGDPIAAITIRNFQPDVDWMDNLESEQKCPVCKGHAAIVHDTPRDYWTKTWRQTRFMCIRRGCQFHRCWTFDSSGELLDTH